MTNRYIGLLVWIGFLLLMASGVIAGPSIAPMILPSPTPSPTPTATPTPTPTPLPTPTWTSTPTVTPTPTPTPTPAFYPPTRIVIPSVGIDAQVVPTHWETQKVNGTPQPVWIVPDAPRVGWHETSAPLGRPGNTVLNGHNWPENGPFRFLYQVQPGDSILLYSGSQVFTYQVEEILLLEEAGQPWEVRMANARYILPTDDERVTLVTCHPYKSVRFRLIVIARPVKAPSGTSEP
ncbi:MAG: sortase [Anaerolineae bacterium]|nr:sortase [Anaerolineae bacterium]MDW8068863.1 sortase [Anaerolineae bacterium]